MRQAAQAMLQQRLPSARSPGRSRSVSPDRTVAPQTTGSAASAPSVRPLAKLLQSLSMPPLPYPTPPTAQPPFAGRRAPSESRSLVFVGPSRTPTRRIDPQRSSTKPPKQSSEPAEQAPSRSKRCRRSARPSSSWSQSPIWSRADEARHERYSPPTQEAAASGRKTEVRLNRKIVQTPDIPSS